MARLMSQIKGGFYAAAPAAVAAVLDRLRPPDAGECLILDPCAGEGQALLQLAQGLHAVPYGIELSEDRAALVRESLPEGQSLGPGRLPAVCDQLPLVLVHLVQSALRLRHRRRRPRGKRSSSSGPPTCWSIAAFWPWSARRTWPTATRQPSSSSNASARSRPCRSPKRSASSTRPWFWARKRKATRGRSATAGRLGLAGEADGGPRRLQAACGPATAASSASRSRPTPNWPGSWPRARCDSISNGRRTRPTIAPGRP